MDIKATGKTDIGLVRQANEDYIKIWDEKNLYIVCDGMGGHNAGEVASSTACELTARLFGGYFEELLADERLRLPRILPPSTDVLVKTVRIVNHWIHRRAASDPNLAGMGTTIVAATIEDDIMTLLHVGDSRIYRFFDGQLFRLTVDHSWAAEVERAEQVSAEEARQRVNRNVITRALGVKASVDIDIAVRKIVEDDIYILCTDGLCGLVEDNDIRRVTAAGRSDVDTIAADLVQLARERGGTDNISVVALRVFGSVRPSVFAELDSVTVDAEPPEAYPAEEDWAVEAANPGGRKPQSRPPAGRSTFPVVAAIIVIMVIVVTFYFIFRG